MHNSFDSHTHTNRLQSSGELNVRYTVVKTDKINANSSTQRAMHHSMPCRIVDSFRIEIWKWNWNALHSTETGTKQNWNAANCLGERYNRLASEICIFDTSLRHPFAFEHLFSFEHICFNFCLHSGWHSSASLNFIFICHLCINCVNHWTHAEKCIRLSLETNFDFLLFGLRK